MGMAPLRGSYYQIQKLQERKEAQKKSEPQPAQDTTSTQIDEALKKILEENVKKGGFSIEG